MTYPALLAEYIVNDIEPMCRRHKKELPAPEFVAWVVGMVNRCEITRGTALGLLEIEVVGRP